MNSRTFLFFIILTFLLSALTPVNAQFSGYPEMVIKAGNSANGIFPDPKMFPNFVYTCDSHSLKVYYLYIQTIALARSGYDRKELEKLREMIKSLQRKDGSFPSIPLQETIYYPWSVDGMTSYYCEKSKAGSTALALLALLDAGEPPNSKAVQKGVQYLLQTTKEGPFHPNVTEFVPMCYSENWTRVPCNIALPKNVTNGAYWLTEVCRSGRDGGGSCIELPGIVTTAYVTALLHRLGYDVKEEMEFLKEYLTMDTLFIHPLYLCCSEVSNFSTREIEPGRITVYYSFRPKWFGREDLGFPGNEFDYRDPYESLALPLLYLKEEGLLFRNTATEKIIWAIKESQLIPERVVYIDISGHKRRGPSFITVNIIPIRILNVTLNASYMGWFHIYYGFRFPRESNVTVRVHAENARAGATLLIKVEPIDSMFIIYPDPKCNKVPELRVSKECYSPNFSRSLLDYSWSNDVYSTAVALIWLYAFNETDYKGFQRGIEYLKTKGLQDGSGSFDAYAYGLIALSLQNGTWKRNRLPALNEHTKTQESESPTRPNKSICGPGSLLVIVLILALRERISR